MSDHARNSGFDSTQAAWLASRLQMLRSLCEQSVDTENPLITVLTFAMAPLQAAPWICQCCSTAGRLVMYLLMMIHLQLCQCVM
jgi:hypothetical protein